jgi:hypothetical protein
MHHGRQRERSGGLGAGMAAEEVEQLEDVFDCHLCEFVAGDFAAYRLRRHAHFGEL